MLIDSKTFIKRKFSENSKNIKLNLKFDKNSKKVKKKKI